MQATRIRLGVSGLVLMATLAACGAKPPPPAATAATSGEGLKDRSAPPPGAAASAADGVTCELASVYFEFDSSNLDQRAKDTLAMNQKCAQQRGAGTLHVIGMTDPRGTEEYNLALGDRRARAAAGYLNALGASAPEATSVGSEMASGTDESSWARDRRTDLQLK